jgi:hypothetical protein
MGTNPAIQSIVNGKICCAGKIGSSGLHPRIRGRSPLKPPPLAGEAGEQNEFCSPAKQGIQREGVKGSLRRNPHPVPTAPLGASGLRLPVAPLTLEGTEETKQVITVDRVALKPTFVSQGTISSPSGQNHHCDKQDIHYLVPL